MNKKWFFILVASILVLALAACTGVAEVVPTPTEETIPQDTPEVSDTDSADGHDDDADMAEDDQDDDTDADSDDEAAVIDAAAIFSARCSSCHGEERQGGGGPPLLPANLTGDASRYVTTITNGSGPMPSWGDKLSAEEIVALVEFIMSEPQ